MTGLHQGRVVAIPRRLHTAYHSLLDDMLQAAGMPKPNLGKGKWEAWLREHPDDLGRVSAVLSESTERFRDSHAFDMVDSLITALREQGWPLP